jgi:hypothetical protein
MARHELIEAYRRGEIGPVTFVRRLIKGGMSASAAMALALTLPGAAKADDVCLECPPISPQVAAITNAAATIAGNPGLQHGNVAAHAAVTVAMHNANTALHLLNVAAGEHGYIPGPGPNVPGPNAP